MAKRKGNTYDQQGVPQEEGLVIDINDTDAIEATTAKIKARRLAKQKAAPGKTRLTDKFIRAITPPVKGYQLYADAEVPGFSLRVTSTGVRSFTLDYRYRGKTRRGTLKRWPDYNATAARKLALTYRAMLPEQDPFASSTARTLGELAQDYLDLHVTKKNTAGSATKNRQILNRLILVTPLGDAIPESTPRKLKAKLPKLDNATPVDEVTTLQIEKLHAALAQTPYQANRVLALLSKMFALAVKWKLRPDNPARGVERFHEDSKERFLSSDEIQALVATLDGFHDRTIASALMLMLLTGCRKTEALKATWDMFDLDAGMWIKPSHHTKQKREHRVPLSAPAIALLEGLDRDGDYLFPGRVKDQPLQDIKHAWEKIRVDAGIPDVRMHDLRHTFASLLVSSVSLPVIGRLLGHTQAATTAKYAHVNDADALAATSSAGALITGGD